MVASPLTITDSECDLLAARLEETFDDFVGVLHKDGDL